MERTTETDIAAVVDWETERTMRADGYAAVLTHLNAAISAIPAGDRAAAAMASELSFQATRARGRLRAVLDEPNPFD
jgi:hypothetical protein